MNSRNCMDQSGKTQEFEARLDLLFHRLVAEGDSMDPAEVCTAYELILSLLREIDQCERDIIFFADEGGTWQFSIDWKRVLPPCFQSLARLHRWLEFERRALAVIDEFVDTWGKERLKALVAEEVAQSGGCFSG